MANKKITQLASKTAVLSTDLFPIGDATTGTLYKKTIAELQAAIGGAVVSVNGKVGVVVLTTDDVIEAVSPTNLYFTNTRARGAISLTTTGSSGASTYSSSTGVLNVPTYTLAGLGGITATFLSAGTGISYNSGTGVISYSGTVYTDSSVRGLFSAGTGLSYNSTTGAFSYSGTIYTDASIKALFSGNSPITYNSTTGAIGITGANLTESTSSVLTITGGTGALISAASIQVKQASGSQSGFLSSTDWTTFNSKLGTITLTTTGTSGAATYSGGTLNIPQYQSALTNPVTGTSTSGYVTFWNGSGTVSGDSGHFWDNTNKRLGIGTTSPTALLDVSGNNADRSGLRIFNSNVANGDKEIQIFVGGQTAFGVTAWQNSGVIESVAGLSSNFVLSNYQVGAIIFQNAGRLERMRIASTGALLVNKTSTFSNEKLAVTGSTNIWGVVQIENNQNQADVNHGILNLVNTRSTYAIGNDASIMFSAYNSTASMQPRATIGMLVASDLGGHLVFNTRNDSGSAERMRIMHTGNILMGTITDNGERLYVSGAIRATGTITANSDIILKKNLLKIENALEKVEQINGYTYELKEDDSKRHAGVIAQEIQGVLPEIVNKGNDGLLGVEYGNISALLIEAIKEQQKKIQELEVKLIALGQ
jgi:hypothetical protein